MEYEQNEVPSETISKNADESTDLHEDTKLYKWNKSLKKSLTNKEILAQSILFLIAGYDTTALTLSYVAYNLAMNRNYQEKLCKEIDSVLENHVKFVKVQ